MMHNSLSKLLSARRGDNKKMMWPVMLKEISTIPPFQQISSSSAKQTAEPIIQSAGATPRPQLKPISASIRSNVRNINDIKKLCCRKGCLKCVDTPSYRERTVGSATRRR